MDEFWIWMSVLYVLSLFVSGWASVHGFLKEYNRELRRKKSEGNMFVGKLGYDDVFVYILLAAVPFVNTLNAIGFFLYWLQTKKVVK